MIHSAKTFAVIVACAMSIQLSADTGIRLDPPFWWAGMNEPSLQVLVTADGIRDAQTTIAGTSSGVTIDSIVRLESPNYQLVYLNIANSVPGSSVELKFEDADGTRSATLDMRERDGQPINTFDASDLLYLIMPDRFADGDTTNNVVPSLKQYAPVIRSHNMTRHGGDIKGVEEHLDYIDSLGVTAIWLNPVLENDMYGGAYHGYATTDYYRIDPRLGTNEEYVNFIRKAHSMGLKVVMDMIFNHCGSKHPWLDDMPATDWFNHPDASVMTNFRLSTVHDPYVSQYDYDRTVKGWFVREMPDFNQENVHVMKYLIQNSIWWIELSKIDGIRMDTYPYADQEPMAQWIRAIHLEYPGYNVVGECWYEEAAGSAFWQDGSRINSRGRTELPTVMDFVTMNIARAAFNDTTLSYARGLNEIYNRLSLDYLYQDPQHVLTFLDNHDTDRFLLEMPDDLGSWKQAITFLLTSRGIPQIYYGTELLMHGSKKHGDGNVRLDMPGGFPGDTTTVFTRQGRSALQNEAFDFISLLAHWRRGNDVIAKGSLKHFMPENGMYVYERRLAEDRVVVIMNGNDWEADIDMSIYREIFNPGDTFTDVLTGEKVTIEPNMHFAPRATMVLLP